MKRFPRLVLRPARKLFARIPPSQGAGRYLILRVKGSRIEDARIFQAHAEHGGEAGIIGFTHYVKLEYL